MGPRVITTSRSKIVLYLATSLTFVAAVLWLLQQPHRDAWKLELALGFFALCTLVFVGLLIRPQKLLLDQDGFTIVDGLVRTPKKTRWQDIDEFFVYRLPRGTKMIGFNYRPGARAASPMVRFNRRFGAEGALPAGWAQSPEQMIADLNQYRLQALSTRNDR